MLRFRALLIATTVSAAFVAAGPAIGEVRSWMRTAFPGWFGVAVNGLAGACLIIAIGAVLARVRERRGLRFGLIVAALVLAAASAAAMASASAAQNAVERFHFIQYGLVTWLWYRVMRVPPAPTADVATLVVPALAALVVGAADEAVQWFVPERVGEYRDIFLNGTAILAGLLWSAGLDPPLPFSPRPALRSRRSMAIAALMAAAAIAAFVQLAQLGVVVRDDEIGVAFVSRYSGDELRALAADRAARWARQPPLEMRRYAREDQYLAEGLWHVRARNDAWERGVETAWRENLILERYFAPVLDTPSYAAPVNRWPPEQRRDADSRRVATGAPFVSHANPLAIHTFSPTVLWGAILGLSALVTVLLRSA
ncbi:MAG TPA: VanZ family protein [Vicinamibacterales bacterium]|nr:VanZ family protein [Vicinamibacterales bacterium]